VRARGIVRDEIKRRVAQTLQVSGLSGLEDRPGAALSGGQQQRVAIARALAYEPKLLLLDEPFSNLDAKLREQMRSELKKLLKGLGITVLLVTHDQLEAFGMSDRVAIMNHGCIEQIGSPFEVYDKPANPFVRDFLGRIVLLKGSVAAVNGCDRLAVALEESCHGSSPFRIEQSTSNLKLRQQVFVAIRPEKICVRPSHGGSDAEATEENTLPGVIENLMFAGDRLEVRLRAGTTGFTCYLPRVQSWHEGQEVRISFPADDLSIWPVH
jgi:ABC-type Fe3+/spermidine/putrescine transport system ATPase subunit